MSSVVNFQRAWISVYSNSIIVVLHLGAMKSPTKVTDGVPLCVWVDVFDQFSFA